MSGMRVRFAPSPTGELHVGGARTALFNYLLARRRSGTFVLRIEDTDRERSSEEHVEAILEALRWLGLSWDEGPFFQSAGVERHRADARRLLDSGHAYRCFCSEEEIASRRRAAGGGREAFMYDRACAALDPAESARRAEAGEPHCIRFRVPPGETRYTDLVHGEVRVDHAEIEDFVLLRSDGSPTYNLSVVSDDAAMRITDVIRGDDHVANTPKQILLYQALGFPLPRFGHLPLILGPDRKRLSKRHAATSVLAYRDEGILPEAMVNFLALLGWSPGGDRELMSLEEMIQAFSLDAVGRSGAVFDREKLLWMNGQYIARAAPERLLELLAPRLRVPEGWSRADLLRVVELAKARPRTIPDLADAVRRYLEDEVDYDPAAVKKHLKGDDLADRVAGLRAALEASTEWTPEALEAALRTEAERQGVSAAKLIHPARVAVLGVGVSPGIFDVLAAVGRDRVLRRLARLERWARERGPGAAASGPART
ncbi:MAG: glutamate--tRNA ligase [Acidobacteria bacterium]|nr:MAG: glutamate--tRNA ligase [Acidobacteriota bacterium]